MKTSESTAEINKAYISAAPELHNIAKDSRGYNYSYTSLEKLIEYTKPILAKHKLAIIQMPNGNGITTRIIHESGEWIEEFIDSNVIELRGMNYYQSQGSQITYLRRYMWASLCGIASDDDMDAAGEQTAPTPNRLTQKQLSEISELIVKTNTNLEQFIGFLNQQLNIAIMDISQLTVGQAAEAKKALEIKMKKGS